MTRLYIVRHGNTFGQGETPRRIGARTDIPLVESGIAQAEHLGRNFATLGLHFDRALVSPLLRTRETATIILSHLENAPSIEPTSWLKEVDHGPDEGRTDEEIVDRIGAEALHRWDAHAIAPDGWHVDNATRIDAWRQLYAQSAGRNDAILVVTSNGAARFALMAHSGLAPSSGASLKLRTGAWGRIDVDETGNPSLAEWDVRSA